MYILRPGTYGLKSNVFKLILIDISGPLKLRYRSFQIIHILYMLLMAYQPTPSNPERFQHHCL